MVEQGDMNFNVTALNDLRAQVVQSLEADAVPPPQAAPTGRIRVPRRALALSAIAAILSVIAIAALTIPWSSNPTVAEATAEVAKTALAADYPPNNWFTFTRSRQTRQELSPADQKPFLVRTERRAWLSVDRRGTIETKVLSDPAATPLVYPYPAFGRYRIGDETYSRREIDAFARDPQALVRQIDAEAASVGRRDADATKWTIITEALRDLSPPLPATLRASLISELATVTGVNAIDADEDPLGRPAVGLAFAEQDTRSSVWFDKATSALSYSAVEVAKIDGHRGPDVRVGDTIERFELLESRATPIAPKL
jgi:hypothetical protein